MCRNAVACVSPSIRVKLFSDDRWLTPIDSRARWFVWGLKDALWWWYVCRCSGRVLSGVVVADVVCGGVSIFARLEGGVGKEALLVATDGARCCRTRVVADGAMSVI